MNLTPPLRILIIAEDSLSRAGLAMLLGPETGFEIAAQIAPGNDLAEQITLFQPDMLVWDFGWEPTEKVSGSEQTHLDLINEIDADSLSILGLVADDSHIAQIWAGGVHNLLLRTASQEQLMAALNAIDQGLNTLDPVLALALTRFNEAPYQTLLAEPLTPRELEVLQLLAEGLANKAIALRLDISEHTVKFHVNAIMGKLNAQSRTEAAVKGARLGLILL